MLAFSVEQMKVLQAHAQAHFVTRLDGYMLTQLGQRWANRPLQMRRAQIETGVQHGLALGIEEEVYVAQLTLVHMIRGEAFMREPATLAILDDAEMTWRQKLFQLIALAGIDLSDGAARQP